MVAERQNKGFGRSAVTKRKRPRRLLSRRTVDEHFWNTLVEHYPTLRDNAHYRAFAAYLMFHTGSTRYISLSENDIRTLLNIQTNRVSVETFLRSFQRDVMPDLAWSDYRYVGELAREIKHCIWVAPVEKEIERIRTMYATRVGTIDLLTGTPVTQRTRQQYREVDQQEALESMALGGNPDALALMRYLNGLAPHRFKKLAQNIEAARHEIERLAEQGVIKDRRRQLDILGAIAEQPQPFYRLGKKTPRLYTLNESILRLKREVRAVMTQGLVSVDLKSAQLAIAQRLWGIESAREVLQSDTWAYFWLELGAPQDAKGLKDIVKQALYAIMYGMSLDTLVCGDGKYDGLNTLLAPYGKAGADFLAIPLIRDVLSARKRVYALIRKAGGAYNAYGQWITNEKPSSVAAQVIQSYEMKLLAPILRAAEITEQLVIVLHLHDGCYLDFRDERRKAYWLDTIAAAVKQEANSLNIFTHLVIES